MSLQEKVHSLPEVPQNLWGLWRRTFFQWEDGDIDRSTEVFYLQTPRLFADLRIPATRPDLGNADSLQDLTRNELTALTEQMAFAGYTKIEDDRIYWNHAFDNLPDSSFEGAVDVGRFRIRKNVMQEFGVEFDYTEYWRRVDEGDGKFISLWAEAQEGHPTAILVIGGDHFIYACDHGINETFSEGLAEHLKTASDPARYLASEFSYGRRSGGTKPWEITRSSIPMREGSSCFGSGDVLFDSQEQLIKNLEETSKDGLVRKWQVMDNTIPESEIDAFLNP